MKLDTKYAPPDGEDIITLLENSGDFGLKSAVEMIPALVQAIVILADGRDDLLLDAANLLADGGA